MNVIDNDTLKQYDDIIKKQDSEIDEMVKKMDELIEDIGKIMIVVPKIKRLVKSARLITCDNIQNSNEYLKDFEKKLNIDKEYPQRSTFSIIYVKKTIKDKHNIICLSDNYYSKNFYMIWQCHNGHIFYAKYSQVQRKNFKCAHLDCDGIKIRKLKLFAEQKNGKCLSDEYIDCNTKYLWECDKGHNWYASIYTVIDDNIWCTECIQPKRKTLSLEIMKGYAKSKKGTCLSEEYINNQSHLIWKCEIGHVWNASYVQIQKHWCLKCHPNVSYGELYSREIISTMFNKEFLSCRPNWLQNIHSGKNLELDIYCEDLNIAFE